MNTEEKIIQVPIEDIIPNRFQPRLAFDEEGLKELSESIKQHGIIQPLVVRRLGEKYEIIAGERRYKASTMAGLKTVPAIISNIDDNQSAEIALVENIQRRNLTPIEEAKSYRSLLDRGYMTQEQLAEKMGVSQSSIANKLRLLNLSSEVQDALLQEKISERHARSLLSLPKEEQAEWLKKIISKRLTVRQLDLEIKKAKGEVAEDIPLVKPGPDIKTMVNNATDINKMNEPKDMNVIMETPKEEPKEKVEEPTIENKEIPNKFFNFLEDEAASMSMDSPFKTEEWTDPNANTIEVLEDIELDSPPAKEEVAPMEIKPETPVAPAPENDTFMPFFFEQKDAPVSTNTIEEIKNTPENKIVDPMDSVIKLDPNYDKMVEEKKGLDLKTAINDVRELIDALKEKGFQISLDEVDLTGNYQMTINIKNND